MRIGLVVDAACDLPPEYLAEQDIEVLPIGIRVGARLIEDRREPVATAAFYGKRRDRREALHARSFPLEVAEMEQEMLERWAVKYDHLVCMTITSARSPIFSRATEAALRVGRSSRAARRAAGHGLGWRATVVNSRSMFAGQGVLAVEAARLRAGGASAEAIGECLARVADDIHAYLVADDLYYVLHRAAQKGERSVNWASFALGSMLDVKPVLHCHRDATAPVAKVRGFASGVRRVFDNATAAIQAGLAVPAVCVSYGGDPERIASLPGFPAFSRAARAAGAEVLTSRMSKTGAVNVGAGALCVAFAAAGHRFQ